MATQAQLSNSKIIAAAEKVPWCHGQLRSYLGVQTGLVEAQELQDESPSCPRIKCCLIGATFPANPLQMTLMLQRSSQVVMKAVWKTKLIESLKGRGIPRTMMMWPSLLR